MVIFEILILIGIIIIFIFLLYLIKYLVEKNKVSQKEIKSIKEELNKSLNLVNDNVNKQISYKNMETSNLFKNTTDTLDKKISNQNIEQLNILKNTINSLEEKLKAQSEMTTNQVKEIITRVSSLDNIKTQMVDLNYNISNLEKVLNDKKLRGTFGELRLLSIFESVFGENQKDLYEEQFMLSNGKRVDFILKAPYPIGNLPIDSKFPLENYVAITNAKTEGEIKVASRDFKQDIKKHINDISSKYIIENETASQAIMFIPAESIFSYIYSNEEELIQYSYEKKVWITSPTTIMAILNLLLVVLKDVKRNESYELIYEEISKLKQEFIRYEQRWSNFTKHLDTALKDVSEITTTSKKIAKKFDDIENVNIK